METFAAPAVAVRATRARFETERRHVGKPTSGPTLLRWLIWSAAAAIILSATAVTGGIALFFGPLVGLFYAVFCVVAWQGPGAEGVE